MAKCKVCKSDYSKYNTTQIVCGWKCALEWNKIKAEKEYKKETARMRKEFKDNDKPHQMKLTETACNAYIRARDKGQPCISCGTVNPNILYSAGHYKTVGSSISLRYNPANIHLQCLKNCNKERSGNIAEYRPRLIEKIGLRHVEWLESEEAQAAQNWTIEDLKEIREWFKQQTRLLQSADS
mgnify:CR=1 FL=1